MATTAMTFYGTSVGKKAVMAVTGFILFGFVVVHLLGNLQVFSGPDKLNAYAVFLRRFPSLLWLARSVLFLTVSVHILAGVQLKLQGLRSRGGRYQRFTPVESTVSSRRMIWTGLMVAFFVAYHLLHLTFRVVLPDPSEPDNLYRNFVHGFQIWPVSVAYMIALVLLGLHLKHGLWSMFQSVGLSSPRWDRWRRGFAVALTIVLVAGNIAMPAAVLVGWVQ